VNEKESIWTRNRAVQVASNAWRRTHGGCICADAPNAATSAAAIVPQTSMRQNITRPRATRSSTASSPARNGSTITERKKLLRVLSCAARTRIRRINLRRDPRAGYLQDGKASCASKLAVGDQSCHPNAEHKGACDETFLAQATSLYHEAT